MRQLYISNSFHKNPPNVYLAEASKNKVYEVRSHGRDELEAGIDFKNEVNVRLVFFCLKISIFLSDLYSQNEK